jgi:hypothetical protein
MYFICKFCTSLFVYLYFFFWPLHCLFFFYIRILITPMVSSNSSQTTQWLWDKNSFVHALTLIKIKIFSTLYCSSVNEIHTYFEHVLTIVDSWVPSSNHWNSYFESIKHFNIDFTHDSSWSDILCYYQTTCMDKTIF